MGTRVLSQVVVGIGVTRTRYPSLTVIRKEDLALLGTRSRDKCKVVMEGKLRSGIGIRITEEEEVLLSERSDEMRTNGVPWVGRR